MRRFVHTVDPLTTDEWDGLTKTIKAIGNATLARRFIETIGPFGPGYQTVPVETIKGITEGYKSISGYRRSPQATDSRSSAIIPIISKDFVLHWRDLAEARLTSRGVPLAKAAAAASICARSEDKFILFGHSPLGYTGIMNVEGRNIATGLRWSSPGDAFNSFTLITRLLMSKGHEGPFAAIVHPYIFAGMHRVLRGSSLLEISHVRALLTAGIFKSSLLAPRTGVVVSVGKQNMELVISVDTSTAFLGAKRMNLPFRVFKAVYLRILKSDAICTF